MVYYLINIWKTSRIPRVYRENTKVEGGNRQNRLNLKAGLHLGLDCGLRALCPLSLETI